MTLGYYLHYEESNLKNRKSKECSALRYSSVDRKPHVLLPSIGLASHSHCIVLFLYSVSSTGWPTQYDAISSNQHFCYCLHANADLGGVLKYVALDCYHINLIGDCCKIPHIF